MNTLTNRASAALLGGLLSLAIVHHATAGDQAARATIKPVAGPGSAPGQHVLHTETIGTKKALSYFESAQGRCSATMMIGEAFNGDDVPDMTTVRFETALEPGTSAIYATSQGKYLQLSCEENATSMNVRVLDAMASYRPQM